MLRVVLVDIIRACYLLAIKERKLLLVSIIAYEFTYEEELSSSE